MANSEMSKKKEKNDRNIAKWQRAELRGQRIQKQTRDERMWSMPSEYQGGGRYAWRDDS